jgi:uncharacterized protein RhaS with RHS repeats
MHQVCGIAAGTIGTKTASYLYDANGNLQSGDGRSMTWSKFDKPTQIVGASTTTNMTYGPGRELLTRQDVTTAGTASTSFVGGLFEDVTTASGAHEERHYVGGAVLVTITGRTASVAGTTKTRYMHKDHLGSVTAITDESGNEVESFSFDPWGKRRAPTLAQLIAKVGTSWTMMDQFQKGNYTIAASGLASTLTNRGFTGHEQLDGVGLIHMGGRVYDAEIVSRNPIIPTHGN